MIKNITATIILGVSALVAQNTTVKPLHQKSQTYTNESLQQKPMKSKDEPKKKKSYPRGIIATH